MNSSDLDTLFGSASSYSHVSQGAIISVIATNSNSGTSITGSLTTIIDKCWTVAAVQTDGGASTGGAGTTRRAGNDANAIGDSNGAISPVGSTSLIFNASSGNNRIIIAAFLPYDSSPRYWIGGTANWDSTNQNNWSNSSGGSGPASVPFSATDVILDNNSGGGIITIGSNSFCNNLTGTGYTGVLTLTNSLTVGGSFLMGDSMSVSIDNTLSITGNFTSGSLSTVTGGGSTMIAGNLVLSSGMTLTFSGQINFTGTVSGLTITTAGNLLLSDLIFNGVNGSWALQDDITSSNGITITNGSLDLNDKNISVSSISSSNANTRSFTLGVGTITIIGSGTVWDMTTSHGMTLSAETSLIKLTNASSSSKTFSGGGLIYNDFWLTGSGTGIFIIAGSNTFSDFKCDTPPHTINFTAGSTQTVKTFTVNGTVGNLMTLQSTISGSSWFLQKSTPGQVFCDYLSLQDSHAS